MQPSSESYEVEDRCFRVSVARRLMLPHPAAANPADVAQFCPNKSAAGVICNKPLDPKQHHCYGCRYGGGVDRRHAALARCLADIIQSHSGVKVFIVQKYLPLPLLSTDKLNTLEWILSSTLKGSDVFGCLYCCSFLLQSVPGFCRQHKTRTYGQESGEEQI